jgi:hypothetical protein
MANPPIGYIVLLHIEEDILAGGKKDLKGYLVNAIKPNPLLKSVQKDGKSVLTNGVVLNSILFFSRNQIDQVLDVQPYFPLALQWIGPVIPSKKTYSCQAKIILPEQKRILELGGFAPIGIVEYWPQ